MNVDVAPVTLDTGTAAGPGKLGIVVPCYNEEEVLPVTARTLCALIDSMIARGLIAPDSCITFVDDGSADRTWAIIEELTFEQPGRVHGIKLSRNQGHQAALLAGLLNAPGDMLVSIDADLQDDPETIVSMVTRFDEGCDIVFGVRAARPSDTMFKRQSARLYYSLLKSMGANIVREHADFRLMSRRAVTALSRYNEVNLFLRGIVPLLGFKTATVYYSRGPRMAGETKYSMRKMVKLSIDGITSFSMQPLRIITAVGLAMSAVSFALGLWAVAVRLFTTFAVPGWTSIVVPTALIGGLQLLSLGIIGEYVGKIYLEVKRRPLFEIEKVL